MERDIRLPTAEYELNGKKYTLVANMNVLAEIQEANNGDLLDVFSGKHILRSGLMIGAAMLNEAAAIAGDSDRFTPQSLGRMIKPSESTAFAKMAIDLVLRALSNEEETTETEKETDPKN